MFRHILAAIHFNSNLMRKVKECKDGSKQIKVTYPKFKDGEATVRDVKKKQNFAYVEEIYQTYLTASSKKSLDVVREELEAITPDPMNTMFEKQPREVAIRKQKARKSIVVDDVPPTTPGRVLCK